MQIYKEDLDAIESLHVYIDWSPVTGSEMQGMVLDAAFRTGLVQTLVMPGCVMRHGRASATDKAIAFLHAITLMLGIDL